MKARTKFQRRVEELAQANFAKPHPEHGHLVQIVTKEQKEWIFENCFEHKAYATKHKAGCMDCGATFPTSLIENEKVTCPECKRNLKVVHTKKRLDGQSCFVAQAVPVKEFQVIRNFYASATYRKGEKCSFHVQEVLQYWADTKGNTQLYGMVPSGWSQNFSGDFECRKDYGGYWGRGKWNIDPYKYLPGSRFRKEFSRAGISKSKLLKKYHFLDAATIFMNPIGETLYKMKQHRFLEVMKENPRLIKSLWPSMKICFRRKYEIYDATTWIDYVRMLKKYGRDIRSPRYICPEDLDKEHNRYVEKERRARERYLEQQRILQLAEQLERDKKMEEEYAKKKGKYIGLEFSNQIYSAKFLNSVQEFKEEGDAMRHCIFSREYFKEPSLLFSVRKNGERFATAEISIKTWRVLQCRTFHNVQSPESNEITEFITDNFHLIRQRMKPKKKKPARVIQERELEVAC